ncbi:MAG: hypothetical protein OXS29_03385 [bacterium]|nr:hypothetical protein [bacterium]MDE0289982.1 hypothetical protein [bacterium]MDE0437347.1 hypothetical protein [bacterium]
MTNATSRLLAALVLLTAMAYAACDLDSITHITSVPPVSYSEYDQAGRHHQAALITEGRIPVCVEGTRLAPDGMCVHLDTRTGSFIVANTSDEWGLIDGDAWSVNFGTVNINCGWITVEWDHNVLIVTHLDPAAGTNPETCS